MKKILMTMAAVLFAAMMSAQTIINIKPDTSAGMVEIYPCIAAIYEDTNYEYDKDSIVSIDSAFDVHGSFVGFDTNYLCTDTTINYDTTYIDHYVDLHAVANEGWVFDKWVIILYPKDSSIADTLVIYNKDTIEGEEYDMNGWLDFDMGVAWIDSTWNETDYDSIIVDAIFYQDTALSLLEPRGTIYKVYPNPTQGTVIIEGEINTVSIYDANGRRLETISTNHSALNTIDLKEYPAGVYYIRTIDMKGIYNTFNVVKY